MTDAKALHRDLMKALLTHIPRSTYHDIRRVVTLAWAIVGLCLTRTVRLTAWAEVVEGRGHPIMVPRTTDRSEYRRRMEEAV